MYMIVIFYAYYHLFKINLEIPNAFIQLLKTYVKQQQFLLETAFLNQEQCKQ